MARIRTIKPEFFSHEDLFTGEQETGLPLRLAYAGLWTVADREGRFKWKPMQLKTAALPYDEVDFSRVLDALATRGFIFKYEISGVFYGVILSWKVHQFINNKEPQSLIPAPPQDLIDQEVDAIATRRARDFHASLTRGVKERKGKEGNIEESKPSTRAARCDSRFKPCVEILERYHRKFVHKTGFDVWFGNRGGKQLKNLLNSEPQLSVETFEQAIFDRARSPGIDHEKLVFDWVFHVIGGTRGNGNGQIRPVSKADERERRIIEQAQKYAGYQPGSAVDSESTGTLALPGNGGDGVRGLAGNPEFISPERDSNGVGSNHAQSAKAGRS